LAPFYDFIRLYPEDPEWDQFVINNLEDLKENFFTPMLPVPVVVWQSLSKGWNSFNCIAEDIGKNLGEINMSLIYENLPWLVLSKQNATGYYTFVKGYRWNADIQIYSTDEILWIYVTADCVWKRLYP